MKNMYGVYHGQRIELLGKRAILCKPKFTTAGSILAQFDFSGDTMNERNDGGPLNILCFGWHRFPCSDFTLYPAVSS